MLTVSERRVGDALILDLEGELSGFMELRKVIVNVLGRRERRILVNLEGVTSCSDECIGELIAGYTEASNRGSELKLLKPSDGLFSALRETGISVPFERFDDEADAVASFEKAHP